MSLLTLFIIHALTSYLHSDPPQVRQPLLPVLSADGRWAAYVVDDSLMIASVGADNAPTRKGVSDGMRGEAASAFAAMAWSPDGRSLLYRRGYGSGDGADGPGEMRILNRESGVSVPFFADSLASTLRTFQNSQAGGPSWSPDGRHLGILAVRRGDAQYGLQLYVRDMTNGHVERWTPEGVRRFSFAWSPNGQWLAIASGDLSGSKGTIELRRAESGSTPGRIVFRSAVPFLNRLLWSPDSHLLLAQDRSSKPYLMHVEDVDSVTVRAQRLPSLAYKAWLGDSALIATATDHMSSRMVRVSVADGARTYLSGPDTTSVIAGMASGRILYRMESGGIPPELWWGAIERSRLISKGNVSQTNTAIDAHALVTASVISWTRGDGTAGDAQLLMPAAHGAAPVPLVVMPYGGYFNTFARSEYFLDEAIMPLLAAGWAVIRPNTRGTATDNLDMDMYGVPQLRDTELLIDELGRKGIVDPKRVAVMGHSHGGAMAYYYLTHSTRFCAVAAINGRADWILQANYDADGVLPDALGGTPDSLPARYREFSPVLNVRSVTAPLLAVGGRLDTQILPANVTIMADSMRAAGKTVHTLLYADEAHLLLKPAHREEFRTSLFSLLAEGCSPG